MLAVLLLWGVVQAGFVYAGISPILKGDLADSDAYLQLVKVSHLVETGDWYDSLLPRSNWPYGEVTTWTRSVDIVLVAGAALLRPFMSFHDALFWFGVALSPLCALACAYSIGWMAKPMLGPEERLSIMLLLLLQPGVLSYTYARGPNHHGLLFLAFIFACGFVLRALGQPEKRRAAIGAGVATGVGLWISMEFLLPLVVVLASFGLLWLRQGDRWVGINRSFSIGFALAVAVLLPIERSPFAGLLADEYDRLSIVHLMLALIVLAAWTILPFAARYAGSGFAARALSAAVVIGLAGAAMYAIYPKFFGGPFVDADPALIPFLITGNADWQSSVPTSLAGLGRFLMYLGTATLCLPWTLRNLWIRRHDRSAPAWLFLLLMLLVYVAISVRSHRFSGFAEIASLIALVDFIGWVRTGLGRTKAGWQPLARAGAVTAIVVGLPSAGALALSLSMAGATTTAGNDCRLADIAPVLNDPAGLGGNQHVILAEIHDGSEILYRTPHAVLATPMIRNAGVLDAYRILSAPGDTAAESIVQARHVDLILLCPGARERQVFGSDKNRDTFYNRLVDGHLPSWIQPVALSGDTARHFRLFAVRHAAP